MPTRKRDLTTQEYLDELLARDPDIWMTHSLADLAREIGVSRQYVHALLPGYTKSRARRMAAAKLQQLMSERREEFVARTGRLKPFTEIARAAGLSPMLAKRAWSDLGLAYERARRTPAEVSRDRYARNPQAHRRAADGWRKRNPERASELRKRADRRYLAKVLREETCIVCGALFPWTQAREAAHRRKATRVVCSQRCGARAGPKKGRPHDGERNGTDHRAGTGRRSQARPRQPATDQRRRA